MIKGLYHVGFGVRDDKKSILFYQRYLNCGPSRVTIEDVSEGGFGRFVGEGERYRWSISTQKVQPPWNVGGVDFEFVQLLSRDPIPIPKNYKWGDIGMNDICFRVEGLHGLYNQLSKEGVQLLCPPQKMLIDGKWEKEFFYFEDPDGLNIKFEQDLKDSENKPKVRGYQCLGLGVSDLGKSLQFYKDFLGYHQIVWDVEGHLDWMDNVAGQKVYGRSVMLGNYYDDYLLQLIHVHNRKTQYLFKNKRWGDIGIMEVCYTVEDLEKVCEDLREKNIKILVEPQPASPQLDYAYIVYVADPDGNYVEFSFHHIKR